MFSSLYIFVLATTVVTALKNCGTDQPTHQQIQDAQAVSIHASSLTDKLAVEGGIDINMYVVHTQPSPPSSYLIFPSC